MIVGLIRITIHAPWVHSLKEKRMIVKSILAKARNKFNISIAEVDNQDVHQSIVIAYTYIASNTAQADSIGENVLNFIEGCTEGEIVKVEREII